MGYRQGSVSFFAPHNRFSCNIITDSPVSSTHVSKIRNSCLLLSDYTLTLQCLSSEHRDLRPRKTALISKAFMWDTLSWGDHLPLAEAGELSITLPHPSGELSHLKVSYGSGSITGHDHNG